MTKEEIKAKIQATIAGQGSAVDIGGQLPAILEGILDAIPAEPEPVQPLTVSVVLTAALDPDLENQDYLLAGDDDYETVIAAIRSGRPVSFMADGEPQKRYAYAGEDVATIDDEYVPYIGVTAPQAFNATQYVTETYPVFFREI